MSSNHGEKTEIGPFKEGEAIIFDRGQLKQQITSPGRFLNTWWSTKKKDTPKKETPPNPNDKTPDSLVGFF